ncbi:hypothetical protein QTI51_09635 [Variovorax sp. J22G73]|uniref:gp53-like domain-containing protein n=1 Tax=unclassified Variovorax TaxID=663243 RepID=UPI002578CF71|nr:MULTISPECIES: hypothetical protein [unclassified Variovorax]MDM0006439.1 hypothetical protein [Variovorax sp. J22R203]MDM0097538.1 hypothetical protein [Variovorax sp. J22G73]
MSNVIVRAHQVGISATAAQNFTLQTPAVPDGTMKLARGLKDATTQDILTVGTDGKVTFNQGIVGLEGNVNGNGWQKLPSGLILAWGTNTLPTANVALSVNYGITFPHAAITGFATVIGGNSSGYTPGVRLDSNTSFSLFCTAAYTVSWLVIGY